MPASVKIGVFLLSAEDPLPRPAGAAPRATALVQACNSRSVPGQFTEEPVALEENETPAGAGAAGRGSAGAGYRERPSVSKAVAVESGADQVPRQAELEVA